MTPTKSELIADIESVANELGTTPTATQYHKLADYGITPVQDAFGTWNDALETAGLTLNQKRATRKTVEDFCEDLRRVSEIVDRTPRRGDVDKHGEHNPTTYQQRVPDNDEKSQWNTVLSEAGFEPYYEIKDTRIQECEICGDEIEVKEYRNDRRFCSTECHGEWRSGRFVGENNWTYNRETAECAWCGGELKRTPWRIEHNDKHFCDDDCQGDWISQHNTGESHPLYKEGHRVYGEGFDKEKKEKVRERDGQACQICNKTREEEIESMGRELSVHHLVAARKFDDDTKRNAMDNLITLCHSCHIKWEGMPVLPVED